MINQINFILLHKSFNLILLSLRLKIKQYYLSWDLFWPNFQSPSWSPFFLFFFIQHIVILKYSYIRGPLSLVSPGTHKISGLVLMPCQPPCPHRETQVAPHTPCPSRLSSSPYLWFIVLYFVVCFVEGFMVLGVRCFEFVCWLCDC